MTAVKNTGGRNENRHLKTQNCADVHINVCADAKESRFFVQECVCIRRAQISVSVHVFSSVCAHGHDATQNTTSTAAR